MALPNAYTQLKYIQATGTQYINTGVTATANTTAKYKYSIDQILTYGPHVLSGQSWYFPMVRGNTTAGTFVVNRGGNEVGSSAIAPKTGFIYEVDASFINNKVTVNGVEYGTYAMGNVSVDNATLHLMTYGGSPGDSQFTMSGKLYYCQIYESGSLIRDFIPAQNSTGTVGLYDAANGVFYANAGSGAFEAGPVVTGAVDGNGATIIAGVSFSIKEGKAMLNGAARKITEGMTKVNGAVKKIALAAGIDVAALAIAYSGAYTDQKDVVMSGKTYRLLTLTGSGTLTLPQEITADVWLCAGGNGGATRGWGRRATKATQAPLAPSTSPPPPPSSRAMARAGWWRRLAEVTTSQAAISPSRRSWHRRVRPRRTTLSTGCTAKEGRRWHTKHSSTARPMK